MLLKVDLHPDVVWFVQQRCTGAEQQAFYAALQATRTEPVGSSEAILDPGLSRYMLRFFRFANCLAVFHYDPARGSIKVLECRRMQPKRPS
jgi:hypothetical protein